MPVDEDRWDPNLLIVCPYDDAHRVAASRYQRHILKCRKNHPDKDTVSCPYNARHIILRPELRSHLGHCPDRVAIDADVIQGHNEETGEIERLMGNVAMPERRWTCPAESEDWDVEAEEHETEKINNMEGINSTENNINGNEISQNNSEVKYYKSPYNKQTKNSYSNHNTQQDNNSENSNTYVRMAGRGFRFNAAQTIRRPQPQMSFDSANNPTTTTMTLSPGRGRGTILTNSSKRPASVVLQW